MQGQEATEPEATAGKMDWFKIGKEVQQAVYCYSVYLNSMQSTSCEMPG